MPPYIRQDKFTASSCGPVAIYNALRWSGMAALQKGGALPLLEFSCRMDAGDEPGTLDHDFDRTLRYAAKGRMGVRRPKEVTMDQLRVHLAGGGAAAVGYYWKAGGHYTLLIGVRGKGFVSVNDTRIDKGRTLSYKRLATVEKWIHGQKTGNSLWLLTRRLEPAIDNCPDVTRKKEDQAA